MKKLLVIALLALFALPSCTKYEEGPFFSLRTKSQRVQNDWTAILYEVDGTNILQEFDVLYFFDKERVRLQYIILEVYFRKPKVTGDLLTTKNGSLLSGTKLMVVKSLTSRLSD